MREPERMPEEYDDLLARVQAAASRVTPGPGVVEQVRGALARRRRRRRVRVALAGAASAAVLAAVGIAVVPGLVGGDSQQVPTSEGRGSSAVEAGLYRPAGFFEDVVGGEAVPSITRYYRIVQRVVFSARFEWTSDPAADDAFLADLTLERYRSSAERRCGSLVDGAALCDVREDGSVLARYEVPADGALLAPISGEGRLQLPGSSGVLRGVTYFRDDALAVTVLVCNCSSIGGVVLADAPPVSFDVLEDVVTDPSWGLPATGG